MNEVWKKPPVSFEAYQAMVGKEIGVSSWHLIDQNRINVYADVIEDHQFIHVDPERAKKETAFGNTIAHGFLCSNQEDVDARHKAGHDERNSHPGNTTHGNQV